MKYSTQCFLYVNIECIQTHVTDHVHFTEVVHQRISQCAEHLLNGEKQSKHFDDVINEMLVP